MKLQSALEQAAAKIECMIVCPNWDVICCPFSFFCALLLCSLADKLGEHYIHASGLYCRSPPMLLCWLSWSLGMQNFKGTQFQSGQEDGKWMLSAEELRAQAVAAEYNRARGYDAPPGNRFKGFSPLLRGLYWVKPGRLWVIPLDHAFFLGAFKDLMNLVFSKEPRKQV